jgi:hypothetical protein
MPHGHKIATIYHAIAVIGPDLPCPGRITGVSCLHRLFKKETTLYQPALFPPSGAFCRSS